MKNHRNPVIRLFYLLFLLATNGSNNLVYVFWAPVAYTYYVHLVRSPELVKVDSKDTFEFHANQIPFCLKNVPRHPTISPLWTKEEKAEVRQGWYYHEQSGKVYQQKYQQARFYKRARKECQQDYHQMYQQINRILIRIPTRLPPNVLPKNNNRCLH